MATDDDSPPTGADILTEQIKSRILDRVLADLREDLGLGGRANGYTKSDSGIYGKYQKQTVDLPQILEAIRLQTEQLLAEYRAEGPNPASPDEPAPKPSSKP